MAAALHSVSSFEESLGSGTSQTWTFPGTVPTGAKVILTLANYPGGAPTGVTDNQGTGNTYAAAVQVSHEQNRADIWVCENYTSGGTALVLTMTFDAGGNYNTGQAMAWTGLQSGTSLDKTGTASDSSTVTASGANAQADMLVVGCTVTNGGFDNAGYSVPSGYTRLWVEDDSNSTEGGQAIYKVTSAIETSGFTTSTTAGAPLNQVIATFKVASGATNYDGAQTESAAAADSSTATPSMSQARAESAAIADSSTGAFAPTAARAESAAAADSSTSTLGLFSAQAESAAAAEASAATLAGTAAQAESSAATEAQAATMQASQAQAESVGIADSATAVAAGDYNAAQAETAAAADSSTSTFAPTATQEESVGISDSASAAASGAYNASIAESIEALDSSASTAAAERTQAESAAIADAAVGEAANYLAAQAESAGAADASSAAGASTAAVAESVAAAETTNALPAGTFEAEIAESVGIVDSADGVSDNVPSDLDPKLIGGGNVKFKPLAPAKQERELPLAADITNMPDAPPPATRYELGILASLAMNTPLPEETPPAKSVAAPAAAPAPRKIARGNSKTEAKAPPAPAPAAPAPAPAVNLEELVGVVSEMIDGRVDALQKQLDAMAVELAEAQQRARELEIERQVDEIEAQIVARRATNTKRAEEIVRKIMSSH